jgi:hypothetical protein
MHSAVNCDSHDMGNQMQWDIRPKKEWRWWFALWPTQVDGRWIWLEWYLWRDQILWYEARLPDAHD